MSIETLIPSRIVSSLNFTPLDLSRITEGVGNDDGLWMAHDNPTINASANITVAFQAPGAELRPGVGLQRVRTRVRAPQAPPSIPVQLFIYEGGVLVATLVQAFVGSLTGEIVEVSFDAAILSDIKGRSVEVAVQLSRVQDGFSQEGGSLGSVEWVANTVAQEWREEADIPTVWRAA